MSRTYICFLFLLAFPVIAQSQTLVSGPCGDTWAYNHDASISSAAVTFPSDSGSAYDTNKIDLTQPFDLNFQVMMAVDGLVFTLQNEGLTAIGGDGGGQGYGNTMDGGVPASSPCVGPSVGIEIDTWDNYGPDCNDPSYDHVGVRENGIFNTAYVVGPVGALVSQGNIVDGNLHTVEVKWSPSTTTMTFYFDGVLRLTYTKDIINNIFSGTSQVYWGWTGASSAVQYIIVNSCPSHATSTQTSTSTPLATNTQTPSPTQTNTNTPLATNTQTSSPTQTSTSTVTNSQTQTFTATMTNTSSVTNTQTQTATVTDSQTQTNTPTVTNSQTQTATATMTNTATVTNSQTQTATVTNSQTQTNTQTVTNSQTQTNTPTVTNTETVTFTETSTNTPSFTPTQTDTQTVTNTETVTYTETLTNTETVTNTQTVTNTYTSTPSPTSTGTYTATPVNTFTATATPTVLSSTIIINPPYPNPITGNNPITISVDGPLSTLYTWDVFSLSFRKIRDGSTTISGPGTFTWDLKDKAGIQVANGLYYLRVKGWESGIPLIKTFKILVLR